MSQELVRGAVQRVTIICLAPASFARNIATAPPSHAVAGPPPWKRELGVPQKRRGPTRAGMRKRLLFQGPSGTEEGARAPILPRPGMHWRGGGGGGSRAPSLCAATVALAVTARLKGNCNRQQPPPTAFATPSNRLPNRFWGRL